MQKETNVMGAVEWAEFGKMYNRLVAAGIMVAIVPNAEGQFIATTEISVVANEKVASLQLNVLTQVKEWKDSPLEAIKDVYMPFALELEEGEELVSIVVTMPSNMQLALQELADVEGMPIDEVAVRLLDASGEKTVEAGAPVTDFFSFLAERGFNVIRLS